MEADLINPILEGDSGGGEHTYVSTHVCVFVCVRAHTNKDSAERVLNRACIHLPGSSSYWAPAERARPCTTGC